MPCASGARWRAASSGWKRSCPASTGVWVVKTRRHRHLAHGVGRLEPLALDDLPRPLEQGERRVPLVQVEHRRLDADHAERPVAADAEQDLLLDARLLVAAVEARREPLVGLGVGVVARVEQQQVAAAHRHPPDPQPDLALGELDAEAHLPPLGVEHRRRRQVLVVDRLVAVLLPAVLVDELVDVALVIEQPHADDRHAEVAHALQVVAGEHPEAARVDGQRLVEPELGREVGDGEGRAAARHGSRPSPRRPPGTPRAAGAPGRSGSPSRGRGPGARSRRSPARAAGRPGCDSCCARGLDRARERSSGSAAATTTRGCGRARAACGRCRRVPVPSSLSQFLPDLARTLPPSGRGGRR